jgi:hypothetical protein
MRKTPFIFLVLSIFILMVSIGEGAFASELNAKIMTIKSYMVKPGGLGPDGEVKFTLLLETILQAAPETHYPQEFTEIMVKAKELTDYKFLPDGTSRRGACPVCGLATRRRCPPRASEKGKRSLWEKELKPDLGIEAP